MIVRLKKDLSKYRFGFGFGAICEADDTPVSHPKITWEKCYALHQGNRTLVAGSSSFDVIGKDNTEAQLFLLQEKNKVIADINKAALVVLHEYNGRIELYDGINRFTAKSAIDCSPEVVAKHKLHAKFVADYVQEVHISHLILHNTRKDIKENGDMTKYEYVSYTEDGEEQVEKGMVRIQETWKSSGHLDFAKHLMERKLHAQKKA